MTNRTATLGNVSDPVLEQLVEEIVSRIQAGELVSLEDFADHPEYTSQLQELLPAMQVLLAFGQSESGTSAGAVPSLTATAAEGLLGDFRILRELGRGGMGIVYEAQQVSLGRRVALKVLPFASMLEKQRLTRFKNEARAAATLDHPNIVAIYSVGAERGVHYYAMQLIEGHSLAQVVDSQRRQEPTPKYPSHGEQLAAPVTPLAGNRAAQVDTSPVARLSTLPDPNSREYFRSIAALSIQAADALDHAHENGILHRDIKPGNLLVDDAGKLWVTDFGLARIEADAGMTMTGDMLGTLRYMSPEQALAKRVVVDHRSDIYSLGATLYELLTLRAAYTGDDRQELLRQIAFEEPRKLRSINSRIAPDLETIVLKAMEKNPADRYATAKELADDLRRFVEDRPIVARKPSLVHLGRRWAARHAALVSIVAASLAVVAAVGGAAAYSTHQAYKAEARQRRTADANLAVASQLIDRLLSRTSDERYWHGDLEQAESLAAEATTFYEQLLAHNDDVDLRFRAAQAHADVAGIWQIVGRHEKASESVRRARQILERLATTYPERPEYLAALARNYNQTGLVDWSLDRALAAEPPFRQAWEIYTELAEEYPHEPAYRSGVADMLANLACVCYFTDRFADAEEYYARAEDIARLLPQDMKQSASGLASQAGSMTNQAELARLRGQYDQALQLLEAAIPLHVESLKKWPTNPVALDCYCHTLWNMGECHLGAERPEEAAAAVERLVATFPDRLHAYHEGAVQLLRCADKLEVGGELEVGGWKLEVEGSPATSPIEGHGEGEIDGERSESYRQRARELVAEAKGAPQRTPESIDRFAWFLLTCNDESLRDPRQALALTKAEVETDPERGGAWFTLALAHYRTGNWQAAADAVEKSIQHTQGGEANAYDWALLAMIYAQQGNVEEARQEHRQAADWIAQHETRDADLLTLTTEAEQLLQSSHMPTTVPRSTLNPNEQ